MAGSKVLGYYQMSMTAGDYGDNVLIGDRVQAPRIWPATRDSLVARIGLLAGAEDGIGGYGVRAFLDPLLEQPA